LRSSLQRGDLQRYLPQGVEFAPFRVQPLEALVDEFRGVLRLHRECDGVHVTSARRGPQGKLIFSGTATVALTDQKVLLLNSALALAAGLSPVSLSGSFDELEVVKRSSSVADVELQSALEHLQGRRYEAALAALDVAVLHAPENPMIWYLLGLYHLSQKDTLRARQSLYRSAMHGNLTLSRLERLQGPEWVRLRSNANALVRDIRSHLRNPSWLEKELRITKLPPPPKPAP
jgi:tetratricopeptide (TPR) repeat protein